MDSRFKLPTIEMPDLPLPPSIAAELTAARERLTGRPALQRLYANCFPNTLQTTTKRMDDGTTFVITGDIPAMWLRDSVEQVMHYMPFAREDEALRNLLRGLVRRHAVCLLHDPYANAFNEADNGNHWDAHDQTDMSGWVWERKFELDSPCFSVRLAYHYWKATDDASVFDEPLRAAMGAVVRLFGIEQHHAERSTYRFMRTNCPALDTLAHDGAGTPVGYTGMVWSGFRPSDDACAYHYHIPSNMMAVVALRQLQEMMQAWGAPADELERVQTLEREIDAGIRAYGIVSHPEFGEIYAYETDGLGHHCLLDDAGTPGLLSIPYIGYAGADDPIYRNTRRFALSAANPYYYEGRAASGIGSPHTPERYIWHMALSMQGLTAESQEEQLRVLELLERTDAGTGFMHEGFHADDPSVYTRPWFAWSNSLFARFVRELLESGVLAPREET
ncbi:glycoside hydrolase family 125 protein [Paenibacillus sp. IB182496]|uniref:Glycoside hydrolase family 125 protein n=1 Tax=Paenibacillus sabuli TaxID=2772509 RepID=A0A927GRT1_9BACL|nr:glycoside hydrolase family 125 protein [Paenibacillus sabuli]MBD2845969.1 glycoside hydrolase family 125 protein [Paenibacillus sabuli]